MIIYIVIANGNIVNIFKDYEKAKEAQEKYNMNREMGGYTEGYANIHVWRVED